MIFLLYTGTSTSSEQRNIVQLYTRYLPSFIFIIFNLLLAILSPFSRAYPGFFSPTPLRSSLHPHHIEKVHFTQRTPATTLTTRCTPPSVPPPPSAPPPPPSTMPGFITGLKSMEEATLKHIFINRLGQL